MKCIVPLARGGGYNKSLNSTPLFALIAGKPVLGHLIDQLLPLKPEEVVFILGEQDQQKIIKYISKNYSFSTRFVLQKSAKGSAHAINGAKGYVKGEAIILFGDTFFEANLKQLSKVDADAVIWTSMVDDPRGLGVVLSADKIATKLIEKPDEPVSTEAMIGLYYVREAEELFDAVEYLIEHDIKTKGYFTLSDTLQVMINRKKRIAIKEASDWIDADHGDGLFHLVAKILPKQKKSLSKVQDSVVIEPSYIAKDVLVRKSVIGPNVSIADGATVSGSVISDSIIGPNTTVSDEHLSFSVVGKGATVVGKPKKWLVDDRSQVSE